MVQMASIRLANEMNDAIIGEWNTFGCNKISTE